MIWKILLAMVAIGWTTITAAMVLAEPTNLGWVSLGGQIFACIILAFAFFAMHYQNNE